MRERLKSIDRNTIGIYEKPVKLVGYEISVSDYEWLVEQTEKVEKLEEEIKQKDFAIELSELNYINASDTVFRYKQTLEKIIEVDDTDNLSGFWMKEIALKALGKER